MGVASCLHKTTTTTNLPHLIPHTNKMKTLLVIAVAVVAAVVVEAAPAPGHHSHHGHREEHVCTEVDIQEIFEDGELIDIIEKIIPVACPEHGSHRPSHHSHHYHHDEDSSEEDSDEDK